MPKFITVTNVHDSKEVDINMDHIESFSEADDTLGETKLYSPARSSETVDMRGYWRVKETPEQIREMLKSSTSVVNVGNYLSGGAQLSGQSRKPPVTVPIKYEVDGIPVSDREIMDAVRAWRGIAVMNNRDSERLNKLQAFSENFSGVRLYAESSQATAWRNQYRIGIYGEVCESLRAAIDALKD